MRSHIKICGIRDVPAALVATEAGATAIGFVLAPSRRRIDPSAVRDILDCMPSVRPQAVGVVVNETSATICRVVAESGIDVVQLAGDEEPSLLDELPFRTWKVMRFPVGSDKDTARRTIDPWLEHQRPVEAVLLDASVPGVYGGSGHAADWELAAELAREYPVILAGGLNPQNVGKAIDAVRPCGVDVSSGVESEGVKNPARIRTFVGSAQTAFASIHRA
jgi:phosphoribosylanthranilate isomerase